MTTIIVDTREQKYSHVTAAFDRLGVPWVRSKLLTGDYTRIDTMTTCVDRKKDLIEVCSNLCQQQERFRRELMRAKETGIRLIILVESMHVKTLEDVKAWVNPRLKTSPYSLSGEALYKRMRTIAESYSVEWQFCAHQSAGRRILELLGVEA